MKTAASIIQVFNINDPTGTYFKCKDILGNIFGQAFKLDSRTHHKLIKSGVAGKLPSDYFKRQDLVKLSKDYSFDYKALKDFINVRNIFTTKGLTSELSNFVLSDTQREDIIRQRLGDYTGAFSVEFFEPLTGYTKEYYFNHLNHYLNWEQQISETGKSSEETEVTPNLLGIKNIKFIKNAGGGARKEASIHVNTDFYSFLLYTPKTEGNDCLFKVLESIVPGLNLNYAKCRKDLGIDRKTVIDISKAYVFIESIGLNNIVVIDPKTFDCEFDVSKKYIALHKNHYYYVRNIAARSQQKKKQYNRGKIFFDCETRNTSRYWNTGNKSKGATIRKLMIQKDTITHAEVWWYGKRKMVSFETDSETGVSSMRKFLNFLAEEHANNRQYNCYAHNFSRFDGFFLLNAMSLVEKINAQCLFRGTSVIKMRYLNCNFYDTCCFLTMSLSKMCKSFKVKTPKLQEFKIGDRSLSNVEMCFYRDELSFDQFMNLRNEEPEFWNLYNEYCAIDCVSLGQCWKLFNDCINELLLKLRMRKCTVSGSATIGGHSLKILKSLNYTKKDYKNMLEFIDGDHDKYEFVEKFKRGGISHCHKPGKYTGISSIDVNSMYPASMINMEIPAGKSYWSDNYDDNAYGFYHLKNLEFETPYTLKPVCNYIKGESLQWKTENHMSEAYVSSFMLKYLQKHYGLKSFDVCKALLSKTKVDGSSIFGKYIDTFYSEKQRQDVLNANGDPDYNPALREVIKLYLNYLSGKMVEDHGKHQHVTFGINFDRLNDDSPFHESAFLAKHHKMGDVDIELDKRKSINELITCGVMIYEYSKMELFEYISCIPNHDIIHIETDGIYFETKHYEQTSKNIENYQKEKGELKEIGLGTQLGGVKFEHNTNELAYFLGKKNYMLFDKEVPTYKIKGVPTKTTDHAGKEVQC